MEKLINNADDLIDYLYNRGVGDSHIKLKKITGGLTDVKFALMLILEKCNIPPKMVKEVISLTGESNVKEATEEFFAFYCSYINTAYIIKMYEVLKDKEFINFVSKLTNIPMILNSPIVNKYDYIYSLLVDKLHRDVAKKRLSDYAKKGKNQ